MFESLKKTLYFPLASYFRFFAKIRLQRWNPKIIVVTGSNGKTTLLHLLESQIGTKAKYSHHANSSYGISFDILDLHRQTLQRSEWISLILKTPMQAFIKLPKEKIYVVEADCDRPEEGKFLSEFLRPDVVLWVSTGRTHSMNFDGLVADKKFATVEEAIAYEYGFFLEHAQKLVVIDGDSSLQTAQISRTKASVQTITKENYLQKYTVGKEGTTFQLKGKAYTFHGILPEEIFLSIEMCQEVMKYLDLPFEQAFSHFKLPPGRGSIFAGIKDTTIIDSTYNANLGSIKAMLRIFANFPSQKKWVVIGDMMELGDEEQEEHETLGKILAKMHLDRVILIGKRMEKYTAPIVQETTNCAVFAKSSDARSYFAKHLSGEETIFFKGSQSLYLEGLIEPLLKNESDISQLPRQENFWKTQRKRAGF